MAPSRVEKEPSILQLELHTNTLRFIISLCMAGVIAVVSMYSASYQAGSFVGVSTFYLSVAIIVVSSLILGLWGVGAAWLASIIYTTSLGMGLVDVLLWSVADTLEGLIPLVAFRLLKECPDLKGERGSGDKAATPIALMMFIPIVLNLWSFPFLPPNLVLGLGALSTLFLLVIVTRYSENQRAMTIYIGFAVLLSSIVGAGYGSWRTQQMGGLPLASMFDAFWVWMCTNIMMVGGFATPILFYAGRYLCSRDVYTKYWVSSDKKEQPVYFETLIYLAGLFAWIYVYVGLYLMRWFGTEPASFIYLVPWALGTMFLAFNTLTSTEEEILDERTKPLKDKFAEIEGRVVVAESNTGQFILVLSILLAFASTILAADPRVLTVLIATVTLACAAITLVWIPKRKLTWIRALKAIKTTLHVLVVSLLLLAAFLLLFALFS
ncbi:MAG: hypothetical protein ACFFCO_09390 [Promethearchaeota archaeon]